MRFHVIASLPRSGSTLLCNILNQNPAFYASDTSPLALAFAALIPALVQRPEFTSMLGHNADLTHAQLRGALRGMVQGYYEPLEREVVFDKDRSNAWLFQADALTNVAPEAKIICLVRDPREVVASVLKRQAQYALFREAPQPMARTLVNRVTALTSAQGLVGAAITAVEDAIVRSRVTTVGGATYTDNLRLIRYEDLAADPKGTMSAIYEALGEPEFEHDFENVENVAGDQDFLYRNLWPHEGCGKVVLRRPSWPHHLPAGLAASILRPYPVFCEIFGYR